MSRTLRDLIKDIETTAIRGSLDVEIRGLAIDSRQVREGYLFGAFPGIHTDGHRYANQAMESGAAAVLHRDDLISYRQDRSYIRVGDSRRALSSVAAAFHGHPAHDLTVFGVTGTDGKSTTVWFIHQLLRLLEQPSGFFSSVALCTDGEVRANPHHTSTPEAHEVQEILGAIRDGGRRFAIVEATSHGLSPRTARLADVAFDVGVFTNVDQEHLEFHGTVEQYRQDKANLFRALKPDGRSFGVINRDDPHWKLYADSAAPHRVLTYSLVDTTPTADLIGSPIEWGAWGSRFRLRTKRDETETSLKFPGRFNIQNFMAAALAVSGCLDADLIEIARLAPQLPPLRGRQELIEGGQPFTILVDYAHTPNSFERMLPFMRELTKGKLILVFGSGGERDLVKRPVQGRSASRHADLIILTDEDPRGEDPMKIIDDIAAGCDGPSEVRKIPDRREAIRAALRSAQPGDTVLCLGKGHENSIQTASGSIAWDEPAVVREILAELY